MSLTDYISTAAALLVKIPSAELQVEIQSALLKAQGEQLELQEQLGRAREENARLSEELRKRDELSVVAGQLYYARHAYWRKDETIDSAYCPNCWDAKRCLVHLTNDGDSEGLCNSCKCRYRSVFDGPRPNEGDVASPEPIIDRTVYTSTPSTRIRDV